MYGNNDYRDYLEHGLLTEVKTLFSKKKDTNSYSGSKAGMPTEVHTKMTTIKRNKPSSTTSNRLRSWSSEITYTDPLSGTITCKTPTGTVEEQENYIRNKISENTAEISNLERDLDRYSQMEKMAKEWEQVKNSVSVKRSKLTARKNERTAWQTKLGMLQRNR